ncbi:glycosyltransferase [Curtobacterium aetherium]|uniref:glycosyltransferase n=1 Tax=Curtobacterium aetherium TaxID=2841594 RepID=UPI00345F52CE
MEFVRRPGLPLQRVPHSLFGDGAAVYAPMIPQGRTVLHLWNKMKVGGAGPWGVSFESRLPRVADGASSARKLRLRLATDESCVFINAVSEYARDRFTRELEGPIRAILESRTRVVYPAVRATGQECPKPLTGAGSLNLIFVGNAFFRKGGEALLQLMEQLGDELDLRLTVVSTLTYPDYATPWVEKDYRDDVASRLSGHPRIEWIAGTSHSSVMRKMRTSHMTVLPSLADTFGYSLAEGAVSGAMVVGSNVQALPEIIGARGRTIDIPLNAMKEWVGVRGQARSYREVVAQLAEGLGRVALEAREDPVLFNADRKRISERSRRMFSEDRDAVLRDIYRGAGIMVPAGVVEA